MRGVFAAEIISNNHLAADRFLIHATWEQSTFADDADLLLDLRLSLDGEPSTSLLQGEADSIEIDAVSGTIGLHGRDLSSRLIEARSQETFANQTSSEIASLLAARHGLTANVQVTETPVGRYWQLEHDSITLDQFSHTRSEWDLLVALAAREGFNVWVGGTTLHFRPVSAAVTPSATLRATPTSAGPANVTGLRLDRALTLARDIEVTVKSWNSRQQVAFVRTARTTAGGPRRSLSIQRYNYVVPNLTASDALQMAQRKLAEISSHERIVVAEMPGELSLVPRTLIAVEATGTGFDQLYVIDEIERRFDLRDGFTQRVRARSCNVS